MYDLHFNHDALRVTFPGLRSCPLEELTIDDLFVSSPKTVPSLIQELNDYSTQWSLKKLAIGDDNTETFDSRSVDALHRSLEGHGVESSLFLRVEEFYVSRNQT